MVNQDSTVSRRSLALEHAHHRFALLLKELSSACIREAPQLPVVQQIPWPFGEPRRKQKIQIPRLLVIPQSPVGSITGDAVNVKRKPLQQLRSFRNRHWSESTCTVTDHLPHRKTKSVRHCGDVVEMWPILWSGEENENGRKMVLLSWPLPRSKMRGEVLEVAIGEKW